MDEGRTEDFEGREQRLPGAPDSYLRKSEIQKFLETIFKAIAAFGVFMGMVFGGLRYVDAVRDYCDRIVGNERVERTNAINSVQNQINQIRGRR